MPRERIREGFPVSTLTIFMAYISSLEECQNSVPNKHSIDWLSLPDDVYSAISNKMINIKDYTRFGAVCTLWQSVYARNRDHVPRGALILMIPNERDQDGQSRSLYSLYENKIYKNFKVPLPHNRHCCGSSHGWLATVSKSYDVSLVNPFLPPSTQIQLPPLTAFRREDDPIRGQSFLKKVVISADPNSNQNYVVMAIHGKRGRLSFFKPGDKTWTLLEAEYIVDVIYDQNKFYALIGEGGNVLVYDANDPSSTKPETIRAEREETMCLGYCRYYLVKSSIDLLQIVRHVKDDRYQEDLEEEEELDDYEDINPSDYRTDNFKILKLDPNTLQWNSVDTLDGKVLFIGDNSSLCLSVSDMPGCKPNCIYFTNDNHTVCFEYENIGPRDVGVYCLEEETIKPFYLRDSKTFAVAPIFIRPTAKHFSS